MSFLDKYEYIQGEFTDISREEMSPAGTSDVWMIDTSGIKIAGFNIELWDAAVDGVKLLEGTDYSLVFRDSDKSSSEGQSVWAGYNIVTPEYQGIPLYLTIRMIGGYTKFQPSGLVGGVIWWPSDIIPNVHHICDGTLFDITDYTELYSILGTTWGGDGTTTFGLPNLSGISPGAVGTQSVGGNLKGDAGTVVGDVKEDQFQGHWHTVNDTGPSGLYRGGSDSGGRVIENLEPRDLSNIFNATDATADNVNGDPRTGEYTEVSKAFGHWVIRVK